MLKSFRVLCGIDDGGVVIARELTVAVGEVDRRVLIVGVDTNVGLIHCVESEWPGSQTFHSSERGAGVTSGHGQRCRRRVVTENKSKMKQQEETSDKHT